MSEINPLREQNHGKVDKYEPLNSKRKASNILETVFQDSWIETLIDSVKFQFIIYLEP